MVNKKLTADEIIKRVKKEKRKLKKGGVKKIGVFGSYAKGIPKKSSDIDFVIEFDKVDFDKYLYILNLLKRIFKKRVDLVIERDLKPELEYVKKEAKYVKI